MPKNIYDFVKFISRTMKDGLFIFQHYFWGSIIVCLFLLSSNNNKCCHPSSLCYDFEIFFLQNCFLIVGHLSSIGHAKVLCTATQIKQAYLVKWWKIIKPKISSKLLFGTPQNLSRLFNVKIFCNMFPLKNYKIEQTAGPSMIETPHTLTSHGKLVLYF